MGSFWKAENQHDKIDENRNLQDVLSQLQTRAEIHCRRAEDRSRSSLLGTWNLELGKDNVSAGDRLNRLQRFRGAAKQQAAKQQVAEQGSERQK
jgi:hypothetical protein